MSGESCLLSWNHGILLMFVFCWYHRLPQCQRNPMRYTLRWEPVVRLQDIFAIDRFLQADAHVVSSSPSQTRAAVEVFRTCCIRQLRDVIKLYNELCLTRFWSATESKNCGEKRDIVARLFPRRCSLILCINYGVTITYRRRLWVAEERGMIWFPALFFTSYE